MPYDISLHPNTTCAQLACPHSLGQALPAKLGGALQRGVLEAQVPGVPGPALGPEPVCGEQLHGNPAAGGAPRAAASQAMLSFTPGKFWGPCSIPRLALLDLAGKQTCIWLLGC